MIDFYGRQMLSGHCLIILSQPCRNAMFPKELTFGTSFHIRERLGFHHVA